VKKKKVPRVDFNLHFGSGSHSDKARSIRKIKVLYFLVVVLLMELLLIEINLIFYNSFSGNII
jgi:hypothetical protein